MSKRITLDNLKTFLTQLKTHITDPIKNDVSTLNTKVRNAENNIITANSNISSVQQSLNDKINSKTNVQSGETISTNNDTIGYFKNIKINGNTHYKNSDGTYTDTWESGVSLESVGEAEKNSDGKYPIEVVSCGKNLFSTELLRKINSKENCNLCSWNEDTEILHLQWNGEETYPNLLSPKVKKNTQYTFSFEIQSTTNTAPILLRIRYTDGSDCYSTDKLTTSTEYQRVTIVSELNKTISRIFWVGNDNTIVNVRNLQLEEGTIATNYEPYKEDKRTILLDSPLRKVDAIADVLDLKKMKVVRKIKSITIDGTITNWVQAKIDNNSILWYINLNDASPNAPSMCNKLKKDDTLWGHDVTGAYRIDETKAFQIRTDKTISNLSALTTWLQSNPITIVYELATPITEDIDVSSNTLTDFTTSCTLTIDNTIKGNIECNEVVGLIPSVEKDSARLANLERDNTTNLQKTLFLRNDGIINKNINNCFNSENGEFRANKSGQYLVMCSGYELQNSSTYVACVVSGISGNQNKLYTSGSSGFTIITLEKDQTLSLYTCVAGNINQECISSMPYVDMLIAKIN